MSVESEIGITMISSYRIAIVFLFFFCSLTQCGTTSEITQVGIRRITHLIFFQH